MGFNGKLLKLSISRPGSVIASFENLRLETVCRLEGFRFEGYTLVPSKGVMRITPDVDARKNLHAEPVYQCRVWLERFFL